MESFNLVLIISILLGQKFNSLLALPIDYWSLDFVSELGFANGFNELWVDLDGRSALTQPEYLNETLWVTSNGTTPNKDKMVWFQTS